MFQPGMGGGHKEGAEFKNKYNNNNKGGKKEKKYKPMKSDRNFIFRRKLLSFSGKVKYLPELLLELNCLGFLMMRNSGRCNYRV